VQRTGGVAAREVPFADAVESLPISPRRRRKETDACHGARRDDAVKTARERAEEKRAEKLALVREQVKSGSLVIRKMTDAERREYPPRAPKPKRSNKR
jgi:hypothetical protein